MVIFYAFRYFLLEGRRKISITRFGHAWLKVSSFGLNDLLKKRKNREGNPTTCLDKLVRNDENCLQIEDLFCFSPFLCQKLWDFVRNHHPFFSQQITQSKESERNKASWISIPVINDSRVWTCPIYFLVIHLGASVVGWYAIPTLKLYTKRGTILNTKALTIIFVHKEIYLILTYIECFR